MQMRVGVAIFSYDGRVGFGVTGDYDTAPDIDVLAQGIEQSMAELLALEPDGVIVDLRPGTRALT
jgi:diacylglycerol O-acyltransferase